MDLIYRYFSAVAMSILAIFTPITPLILCVTLFIGIDFVSGVWASRQTAHSAGKAWFFESEQAWRTLYKLGFTLIAIAMAWLIDSCIITFVEIRLARLFTGFVCGVELWSFLENAAQFSDAPYFDWMRKYLRRRVKQEIDKIEEVDFEELATGKTEKEETKDDSK
ncbi:MAG: phage holin family protein [Rikenellaceae bacterium]